MKTSNWLKRSALGAAVLLASLAACSGRRLPPGTPPPEYEAPIVAPWAPDSGDAGAPKASEPKADPANSPDAAAAPELSLDAGPR